MHDISKQITEQLITQINIKREEIIIKKFAQKGYNIDLKDQAKRRFRDVICECVNNEETWYYNNGSIEGERIITFINDFPKMEFDADEGFSLKNYIKYY